MEEEGVGRRKKRMRCVCFGLNGLNGGVWLASTSPGKRHNTTADGKD